MKTRCGKGREGNFYDLHNVVCMLAVLLGSEVMLSAARLGLAVPGVQYLVNLFMAIPLHSQI